MINSDTALSLIDHAIDAMNNSYAPYSGYTVGAALLTDGGSVYTGCNIENSSYTPTVCAERVAIFKAVSDGCRDFAAMAIVGGKEGKLEGIFPPCGVCRQVMSEFCNSDRFSVILGKKGGEYEIYTLSELFPLNFGKRYVMDQQEE
jgi:cytidine deaminase